MELTFYPPSSKIIFGTSAFKMIEVIMLQVYRVGMRMGWGWDGMGWDGMGMGHVRMSTPLSHIWTSPDFIFAPRVFQIWTSPVAH